MCMDTVAALVSKKMQCLADSQAALPKSLHISQLYKCREYLSKKWRGAYFSRKSACQAIT